MFEVERRINSASRSTQLGIRVRINYCAQCLSQRAVSTEIEHCGDGAAQRRCRQHHPFPPLSRKLVRTGGGGSGIAPIGAARIGVREPDRSTSPSNAVTEAAHEKRT